MEKKGGLLSSLNRLVATVKVEDANREVWLVGGGNLKNNSSRLVHGGGEPKSGEKGRPTKN